jgi:hypothetical protein
MTYYGALELTTSVGFVAMIAFTMAANLMLKLGARVPKPSGFSGCSARSRWRDSLVRMWQDCLRPPAAQSAAQYPSGACRSAARRCQPVPRALGLGERISLEC